MAFDHSPAYYKLTHKPTGRFYIGSTKNLEMRIRNHRTKLLNGTHYSPKFQEVFTDWDEIEVEFVYTQTEEDALELEQRGINMNFLSDLCCNSRKVALKPPSKSEEAKRRISEAMSTRVVSEETREKQSKRRKGVPVKWTEEGLASFRAKMVGREVSEETRQKLADINKGRKFTPEHVQKMIDKAASRSKRPIIDGQEYRSIKYASEVLGISRRVIQRRIRNKNFPTWGFAGE